MRCDNCFEEYDGILDICPYCGYYDGKPPEVEYMLPAGTLLQSRYRIGESLGCGGFGTTYKAYDTKLERLVAIKEYYYAGLVSRTPGTKDVLVIGKHPREYTDALQRFLDEARNTVKFISNPNIIDIMDWFEENNTAYYVMELLVGMTLKDLLKQSPESRLDCDAAVEIVSSIGEALSAIHNAKYIHRDVAPDNIFMCSNGNVKLIDFGAARFSVNETLSQVLKPGYAPAEQYDSVNKQGAWTDVYALGATMYRMVTGVKPDESTNRKIEDTLLPPHEVNPDVPENISNAIMRAMSVESHLRYQTVKEFVAAISGTRKVHTLQHIKKRRKNTRIVGIAASLALVAGLAIYFSHGWNRQKEAATLPDASLTVWYILEDDNEEESHKVKGLEQTITDFMQMYQNVSVEYKAISEAEYEGRLKQAQTEGNPPDIYESTGLDVGLVAEAVGLGGVIEQITPENAYFLENYEVLYPDAKRVPTSFVMPIIYVNTSAVQTEAEVFFDISEFKAEEGTLTYSVNLLWEEYYINMTDFGDCELTEGGLEAFLSGEADVYMGSSADLEEVYSTMTGKCTHMTLEGSRVQCRAGSEWSVSDTSKNNKTAAMRFLAYLIEDPTAQDYLYMQGDYGDKTKLPINRDAVKTLVSDDAQFYEKILEEADTFGYMGETK